MNHLEDAQGNQLGEEELNYTSCTTLFIEGFMFKAL
jgi:hypothetical protein